MGSIERARELLGHIGPFETLSTRRRSYYAKSLLAGYIGAVEAVESIENIERLCDDTGELYGETIEATRLCAEALAEFEKLFPDEGEQ
jgi:hypothetical protein